MPNRLQLYTAHLLVPMWITSSRPSLCCSQSGNSHWRYSNEHHLHQKYHTNYGGNHPSASWIGWMAKTKIKPVKQVSFLLVPWTAEHTWVSDTPSDSFCLLCGSSCCDERAVHAGMGWILPHPAPPRRLSPPCSTINRAQRCGHENQSRNHVSFASTRFH